MTTTLPVTATTSTANSAITFQTGDPTIMLPTGTANSVTWSNIQYPVAHITNSTIFPVWNPKHNLAERGNLDISLSDAQIFLDQAAVAIKTDCYTIDYPLIGNGYSVFIEQDYTALALDVNTISKIVANKSRYALLAIDSILNRLEFSAIVPESDPKAHLGALMDDSFNVNSDKTEYIASLYSRLLPFVEYSITKSSFSYVDPYTNKASVSLTFGSSKGSGILPIMHLSNIVFGGCLPPKRQDFDNIFGNLATEVIVLDKGAFPTIQPYFSPEYAYLTLDITKDLRNICRRHSDYSSAGLVQLLTALCITNTKTTKFSTCLEECIGLDQRVKDTADEAVYSIKRLVESAY